MLLPNQKVGYFGFALIGVHITFTLYITFTQDWTSCKAAEFYTYEFRWIASLITGLISCFLLYPQSKACDRTILLTGILGQCIMCFIYIIITSLSTTCDKQLLRHTCWWLMIGVFQLCHYVTSVYSAYYSMMNM